MGPTGTLGRETTAEVVLMSRLRAALERLNPAATPEAIALAIESLTRNRATMSLVAANRDVYDLLKTGIPVSVPDREQGGQKTERLAGHRLAAAARGQRLLAGEPDDRDRGTLYRPP